jgi:two-component system, NarL family, sensor histidine kinase UhpB
MAEAAQQAVGGRPRVASRAGRHRLRQQLFWRVFAVNAAVLGLAVALLAFTPLSVSSNTTREQLVVLLVGLAIMLAANAVLLRISLSPLRRLAASMQTVDLLAPGERLPASGTREVAALIAAFNATLTRLEDERRASIERVFSAQEAERRRIARELHDQIGQDVTAILLDCERLRETASVGARELLDDVAARVHDVLDDLRRVSYELRPVALDELGLVSAIEALCAGTERRSGIPVQCSFDALAPTLDADVELAVYRIIQEAITNALRHSACSTITVRVAVDGGRLSLRVADDGVGMDAVSPGGGLRGMQERARMIGAALTVGRGRAGGTEIRVDDIPLPAP